MSKKSKQPLMRRSHLPLILLGAVMTGYGLVTALVGSWFSNQAMRGLITAGAYRLRLAAFDQTAGLIAGLLFLVLFILCAVNASGIVRVAFGIGTLAAFSPMLIGRAENLLFRVIGLPTMNAGSVLAGAVTTLVFALPMIVLFILLACGRRVPRGVPLAVTGVHLHRTGDGLLPHLRDRAGFPAQARRSRGRADDRGQLAGHQVTLLPARFEPAVVGVYQHTFCPSASAG